ncbi:phage antirepressor N-terminal domain-containing protein [Mycolicibacterium smegmatis]|uniref:phage antirepressor N-terminal domain-containing protein n=1 Tax=Mycolicibacterium smegmatis TaxID=1772 RepID=UPI001EFADACC|nr:phage antirepressor N-terminal domain-containing protein [Mycolicibacterium smegmatis]ULN72270.1 phage antirepressor N-terminal domain-containing protein [Mycolicibacterium smegmatis]
MTAELVHIPVPGANRQIIATLIDGKPMVSLRHACEAIGLATDSQRRKLRTRSWATVTQEVSVAEDGKPREMTMIDRRTFTMWLGGVDENKVSEEARPVLVAFQAEAADALDAYFNEGGAINPRATEDQLDRLARQAQSQAAVLQALKGIVDSKHLEAKGRVILARALGEAPEIAEADVPLYVSDYLAGKGLNRSLVDAKAPGFGKRLKARYIVEHDREPEQHHQTLPNGTVRKVYAYTEADRPLFDSVWAKHYAASVAESALTVIPGGAS